MGIDLFETKREGIPQYWLNCICWGTSYQTVTPLPDKTPESVFHAFTEGWAKFFGFPEIIVCDPGGEFMGYFAEMVNSYGSCILPTDARSPWQNGRTERAGKEWKRLFKLAQRKLSLIHI